MEGFEVTAADVPHKGGRTFGFRSPTARARWRTCPIICPIARRASEVAALLSGVDLLVHDAQFLAHERAIADEYGHATIEETLRLAEAAGARTLALFHHAPAEPTTTSRRSAVMPPPAGCT